MTALTTYHALPASARATVCSNTLASHGALHSSFDAVVTDPNDRHLHDALRVWWHTATLDEIAQFIDVHAPKRTQELAILLCAESCAQYTTDPLVAECRRVRLAWVRGEVDDSARATTLNAAFEAKAPPRRADETPAAWSAARSAARSAEWNTTEEAAMAATNAVGDATETASWQYAQIAARLRIRSALLVLIPDPVCFKPTIVLLRWYAALAEVAT